MNRWLDESITDTDKFAALLQPHIPDDLLAQQIDKPSTYQPIAEPFTIGHD